MGSTIMRAILSLTACLVAGFLISCAARPQKTGELRVLKAELDQARAERDMLRAKVEGMWDDFEEERGQWLDRSHALRTELGKLQDIGREKAMLQSRCDGLQNRYERLERWASDLARGYGPGIWVYSDDHQWPLYGRKPRDATVRGIVDELNAAHRRAGGPLLVLEGVDGGVATLGVTDALKLTTEMGSSGANCYIQTAVYSLTSLPDIDCVHFDFEEGDHAAPGKYCN